MPGATISNFPFSANSDFITASLLKQEFWEETISYYEVASYLYTHGLYKTLASWEFNQYMRQDHTITKREKDKSLRLL